MSSTPDDLTAELAGIRERAEYAKEYMQGDPMPLSLDDVPRLLAAVEAGLKATEDFDFEAAKQERNAATSDDLGGMIIPAAQRARAETHRDCAKALREAITTALTGEERSDGG